MNTNETDIISRILGGEHDAFRYLVKTYQDRVFVLMVDLTGDTDKAREVTQETFIRAYTHLADYDAARGSFSTWLLAIAFNEMRQKLRKRRHVPPLLQLDDHTVEPADDADIDAFFDSPDEERLKQLTQALATLPPEERLLLNLFYYEDLSLKEISDITGMKAGTVATRLSRIRRRLYLRLKNK